MEIHIINIVLLVFWVVLLAAFCFFCGAGTWKDKVVDFVITTSLIWFSVINDVLWNCITINWIVLIIAVCMLCYHVYKSLRSLY